MTHVEGTVIINRSVEDVFEYASDWKVWHEWFEGVSTFKPTTESSRGDGTRYAYKAKMMGLSFPVETEIKNFVPNKGWSGQSTRGVPHNTFWKFEPVDEGTSFTYGLDFKLPIPLLGPVIDTRMLKPQWENIINNSLKNLKKILESD